MLVSGLCGWEAHGDTEIQLSGTAEFVILVDGIYGRKTAAVIRTVRSFSGHVGVTAT